MLKNKIVSRIKDVIDKQYGFDIYITMKNGNPLIKRFILDEGNPNEHGGFKSRIKESIEQTIRYKYLSEESQYAEGDTIASDQNRIYVIKQDEEYQPFSFLASVEEPIESFELEDKDNADGILFKFTYQRSGNIKEFWAYQKIQPSAIPNKKKNHFQIIAKSKNQPDIFKELPDQMFIITKSVDLLILSNEIVTDKISLMERHFGLENFVRASAKRAVNLIAGIGLIENVNKLDEYIQRSNKRYAKKIMQIHKYPIAIMDKDKLIERLHSVERWKNVFELHGNQIYLKNFTDVENIIDLFVERYTKSEISNQEYDTEVKNMAEPIMNRIN